MRLNLRKNLTLFSCLLALVFAQFGCGSAARKAEIRPLEESGRRDSKNPNIRFLDNPNPPKGKQTFQKHLEYTEREIEQFKEKSSVKPKNKETLKNISARQADKKMAMNLQIWNTILTSINTGTAVTTLVTTDTKSEQSNEVLVRIDQAELNNITKKLKPLKVAYADCRNLNDDLAIERRNALDKYSSRQLSTQNKKRLVEFIRNAAIPGCQKMRNQAR